MSLLDSAMVDVVMLDKRSVPDGVGGIVAEWAEGAVFQAAIVFDSSIEARVGEKQGVTSLYTVTTRKNVSLSYHDVFKRLSDGKIFRITSDGDDQYTPVSSTLNMRQVTAEEWSL